MGKTRHVKQFGVNECWKEDVPDAVDVLDGVADLLTQLLFVKLHLQRRGDNIVILYNY